MGEGEAIKSQKASYSFTQFGAFKTEYRGIIPETLWQFPLASERKGAQEETNLEHEECVGFTEMDRSCTQKGCFQKSTLSFVTIMAKSFIPVTIKIKQPTSSTGQNNQVGYYYSSHFQGSEIDL